MGAAHNFEGRDFLMAHAFSLPANWSHLRKQLVEEGRLGRSLQVGEAVKTALVENKSSGDLEVDTGLLFAMKLRLCVKDLEHVLPGRATLRPTSCRALL
jgi:hypothetical protein